MCPFLRKFFHCLAIYICILITVAIVVSQIELATYLYENLLSVPNVRIYGPKPSENVHRAALCSFNVENIHPTDIATILDQQVLKQAEVLSLVHMQSSYFVISFRSLFLLMFLV